MTKIEIDSGRSSSATHRMTQASTTLNRRYVKRPANIAVEEAARSANRQRSVEPTPAAPSRLVNLNVSSADLAAAKEREAAARQAAEEARMAEIARASGYAAMESFQNYQPSFSSTPMVPRVVEYGSLDPYSQNNQLVDSTMSANSEATNPAMTTTVTSPESQTPDTSQTAYYSPIDQSTLMQSPMITSNQTEMTTYQTQPAPAPAPEIDTSELALNIAADYAAASLGASMQEFGNNYDTYAMGQPEVDTANTTNSVNTTFPNLNTIDTKSTDSVDLVAYAASEAIASIRAATEPSEVSEQVASLKAFAESIKANASMPEMKELGNTIEKFVSIAMKSTKIQEETQKKANSTAAKVTFSPKVTRAANKVTKSSAKVMAASNRSKVTANKNINRTTTLSSRTKYNKTKLGPNELKERAIEEALHSVATMDQTRTKSRPAMQTKRKGNVKRFAIAFACAAICVGGVIAFVSSNIPDISIRVAAMQTGITASYPSYVPRDYTLGDIFSEDGKITMMFNGPNGASFNLVEEKSSWDTSALLRNYIEPTWGDNYTTTNEQGITIYISNTTSDAAWVNSGILYSITSSGTPLTKKQVRSIVVSLQSYTLERVIIQA